MEHQCYSICVDAPHQCPKRILNISYNDYNPTIKRLKPEKIFLHGFFFVSPSRTTMHHGATNVIPVEICVK